VEEDEEEIPKAMLKGGEGRLHRRGGREERTKVAGETNLQGQGLFQRGHRREPRSKKMVVVVVVVGTCEVREEDR